MKLEEPPAARRAVTLEKLIAVDRLEVGPVKVEERRIACPYRLLHAAGEDRFFLEYRYEEDVFDPDDPDLRNVAAMTAAQAALNYSLFSAQIVFRDTFDAADRRFLRVMGENTAREIYVNKLLEPNAFLAPGFQVPEIRLARYAQARLSFRPEPQSSGRPSGWLASNSSRCAVLSSGGKDSLLSFGLLDELGRDPHPIFVNESGRHWFTALNAYRHFRETVPNTSRVWTNADRLFAWMLRHLPFIRRDFAQVRSDYYPLRLWTVAVFLFGSLPLLIKRRIETLVVGDEYDTTHKADHRGIPHFAGLYDQSIYFDRALTAYFRRKKWNVRVVSLIRPLSELLIEKTLAERYPELQRHQVSCHAAHARDGRIYPCGRCEKCRRIMTMLGVLGVDPERCGYTAEQVSLCLERIGEGNLHLEEEAIRHIFYLLGRRAEGCPHVMKLRIHPRNAPLSEYPEDLALFLLPLLLEHADGAVRWRGGAWRETDVMKTLRARHRLDREDRK